MNATILPEKEKHYPVLLNEIVSIITPQYGGTFIDCTFGQGGYTKKILEYSKSKVIALDRDKDSKSISLKIKKIFKERFHFENKKFSQINKLDLKNENIKSIIFDLGYSYTQIKDAKKGLSFDSSGDLNMKMGLNDKVKLYLLGKLDQKELDKVFNDIDLAVDSLAMYRLNMSEASTLKSKEYIARGIPFIYSAIDLDLVDISKYLYDVGNSDSLINFKEILKYYKDLDIIYMKNKMREITLNTLSWDMKIKKLKERIFC